jgi:hypothetical protein
MPLPFFSCFASRKFFRETKHEKKSDRHFAGWRAGSHRARQTLREAITVEFAAAKVLSE